MAENPDMSLSDIDEKESKNPSIDWESSLSIDTQYVNSEDEDSAAEENKEINSKPKAAEKEMP